MKSNSHRQLVYLNCLGVLNALGSGREEVKRNLLACKAVGMREARFETLGKSFLTGQVLSELPHIPENLAKYESRNNRLILAAIQQIEDEVRSFIDRYSAARVGVVLGTSTSGVDETELALAEYERRQQFPRSYVYEGQEIGAASAFVTDYFALEGPSYVVSTACSSSGKVFASARALIEMDVCDAVIIGGADSLCQLTLGGFSSLEAISPGVSNPFSANRKGINIGEAAALFVLSREPSGVALLGVGESSDAYHVSAPSPDGSGAIAAMRAALADANLAPGDIGYINLHGTGTQLNDVMEASAVMELFGGEVYCSSTKPLTGHTLGAAGATEAALCWLLLEDENESLVARHAFDGQLDPDIAPIRLSGSSESDRPIRYSMSNSFAFGGNNVSVVLGRSQID